jgi:hypothetical protein
MAHWTRRNRKVFLQVWVFLVCCLFLYRCIDCASSHKQVCRPWAWSLPTFDTRTEKGFFKASGSSSDLIRTPKRFENDPTVNLVVASTAKDDTSWTSHVIIPNMAVIRYVSDDGTSRFHPRKSVGRESLMYFTYMHDFYDHLSDISIFVHADESPWHVESILKNNLSFALNQLRLNHVKKRKYVNLRVAWNNACPEWINTTHTEEAGFEPVPGKEEEIFMKQAFIDNFRPWYGDSTPSSNFTVPEILAQPCCNQFAATRDIIRSIPLIEYKRFQEWLISSPLATSFVGDYVVGRFWEHSFQYLFTGKPVDCPNQWKAWCLVYGICFKSESQMFQWMMEDTQMRGLEESFGKGVHERLQSWARKPLGNWRNMKKIAEMRRSLGKELKDALARSADWKFRTLMGNLYTDWADGEVLFG